MSISLPASLRFGDRGLRSDAKSCRAGWSRREGCRDRRAWWGGGQPMAARGPGMYSMWMGREFSGRPAGECTGVPLSPACGPAGSSAPGAPWCDTGTHTMTRGAVQSTGSALRVKCVQIEGIGCSCICVSTAMREVPPMIPTGIRFPRRRPKLFYRYIYSHTWYK